MKESFSTQTARSRRGAVTVLALLAVIMVFGFSAAFLMLGRSITQRQQHANSSREAFYLAEAGLVEAYTGLAEARTGNIGSEAAPAAYGDGLLWVEVTDVTTRRKVLKSTAMCGGSRAALAIVVDKPNLALPGTLGIFSNQPVLVNPGTLIDGYDSRLGTYADQVAAGTNKQMGLFGSNADIEALGGGAGTTLDGDVTPGPGGTLTDDGNVTITGSTLPRAESEELPPVEVPPIPLTLSVTHTDPVPYVIPPGEWGYTKISMSMGGEVVVVGPCTLVVDTLAASKDGTLTFDTTNGDIEVYVTGSMSLASASRAICVNEDPTTLSIHLAGDATGSFAADSQFFGTIEAPESKISFASGFELFGAASADLITLASGATLHYDQAVGDAARAEAAAAPVELLSWRIVDIPANVAARAVDPFQVLGVRRQDLLVPAYAHQDQFLEITYKDLLGATKTYSGMESAFDWKDVAEVLTASRDGELFVGAVDAAPAPPPPGPGPPIDPKMTDTDLINAIGAATDSATLANTLNQESPLSDAVLDTAITSGKLLSADLASVLINNSPLNPTVLQNAIDFGNMKKPDLNAVLAVQ